MAFCLRPIYTERQGRVCDVISDIAGINCLFLNISKESFRNGLQPQIPYASAWTLTLSVNKP